MNQAYGFKKALNFFRAIGSIHFVTPDFNPATFEIKTEFLRNEPFNQGNTLFINDGITECLRNSETTVNKTIENKFLFVLLLFEQFKFIQKMCRHIKYCNLIKIKLKRFKIEFISLINFLLWQKL
jgi:hypothetical protein